MMNFMEEWIYKESVLDTYEEVGLEFPDNEVWEYYHHFLQREQVEKEERMKNGFYE